MRVLRVVLASNIAVGMLACESSSSPVPVYLHDVTPGMVTGAALAALRPDGHFEFSHPGTAPGQVSLDTARSQSLEFARYVTNQLLLRGVVEGERGGYWTDPHLLTVCRDAYLVKPQLELDVPDSIPSAAAAWFRRSFGAQWLIPMCGSSDEPQLTVQAAVDGNDVRFADGSPVVPGAAVTTAWYARGVPFNWPDALPISAERAVRFAYETFGTRVTEVPELHFRGDVRSDGRYAWYQIGSTRFCNRWRVVLESDVSVLGMTTQARSTTSVIWIGSSSCSQGDVEPYVHLPLVEQPSVAILDYFDNSVTPAKTWSVVVTVNAPIRFEVGARAN